MIPSKRKLNTAIFKAVLEKGKNYHTENFSLKVFRYGNNDSRFSVAVPKKLEKSAVKRNTMKRLMYGLLHQLFPIVKQGNLSVFFLRKKINAKFLLLLNNDIKKVLKNAGVI